MQRQSVFKRDLSPGCPHANPVQHPSSPLYNVALFFQILRCGISTIIIPRPQLNIFLLPFAGPTRAPEDVSYWFEGDHLLVKWTPIPILFQAYRLQGYAIVATKRDVKIADWNEPANATNISKSGVKADEIDCVFVYGYNKYKGGYPSSCPTTEPPGTLQWFL